MFTRMNPRKYVGTCSLGWARANMFLMYDQDEPQEICYTHSLNQAPGNLLHPFTKLRPLKIIREQSSVNSCTLFHPEISRRNLLWTHAHNFLGKVFMNSYPWEYLCKLFTIISWGRLRANSCPLLLPGIFLANLCWPLLPGAISGKHIFYLWPDPSLWIVENFLSTSPPRNISENFLQIITGGARPGSEGKNKYGRAGRETAK